MTVQTTATVTALADHRRGTPVSTSRRGEGVRRTDDLTGWAQILGEGIRVHEQWHDDTLDALADMGVLVDGER